MEPLALVANLATSGTTCIKCKFNQQMAQLELVQNLVIKWHHLHCLQSWPPHDASSIVCTFWSPDGATCTACKFGLQVAQLALVQNLVISWRHLHCFQSWPPDCVTCIATLPWIPYWYYQLVLSWYPHQPESHQLSLTKHYSLTHLLTTGPNYRTPGLPGFHIIMDCRRPASHRSPDWQPARKSHTTRLWTFEHLSWKENL